MERSRSDLPVRRMLFLYVLAGASLAFTLELTTQYKVAPLVAWTLLPAMALIAEFLPVEISRYGLRITFTLPFLAGMAAAVGPTGTLLTDLLVTLVSALAWTAGRGSKVSSLWVTMNLSVAAIAVSVAGMVFSYCWRILGSAPNAMTFCALAFTIAYGLTNFLLITYTEAVTAGTRFKDRLSSTVTMGAQGILLYGLASIAVAVLVSKGLYLLVPLTLIPIIVLREVLKMRKRMFEHYYETVTALTLMLQRAHPYTHGHIERVAKISEEVALRLGLNSQRARLVREASVLHDIGKIAVDEAILDKPERLTREEFAHVQRHSSLGAQILAPVDFLRDLVPWVKHHHERPDGTGYPDGLSDVEIPVESKIIAVVDAFDAMTGGNMPSDRRTYRDPISVEDALLELDRCSGTQFCPKVVRAFRHVVRSGI